MFDKAFNEMQLKRYLNNFPQDIVLKKVAEIVIDQVETLKQVFKKTFKRAIAVNFHLQNILSAEYITTNAFVKGEYDLIIANLYLHHENDILSCINNYLNCLNPEGVLIVTIFGGHTLIELRQILEQTELELKCGVSPRVIPMINIKDLAGLMQAAKFKQVIAYSESLKIQYKNFNDMINHPRKLGQSNCLIRRNKNYVGREFFQVAQLKADQYFKNDSYQNTFEVIGITAIK